MEITPKISAVLMYPRLLPKFYSASSLRPRKQLIMNSQDVTLYVLATNHSTGHNDRII
jgi:hypothetical protein